MLPSRRMSRRAWRSTEDTTLATLVGQYGDARGSHWKQIAAALPGRTAKDCRKRWYHSLDPSLRKGRWTKTEDQILLDAYRALGPAWYAIALLIPGRKDDQCAKRYTAILDPCAQDRLKEWTREEDSILRQGVSSLGHCWSVISERLPGRPPLTCRNRWRNLSKQSAETALQLESAPPRQLQADTAILLVDGVVSPIASHEGARTVGLEGLLDPTTYDSLADNTHYPAASPSRTFETSPSTDAFTTDDSSTFEVFSTRPESEYPFLSQYETQLANSTSTDLDCEALGEFQASLFQHEDPQATLETTTSGIILQPHQSAALEHIGGSSATIGPIGPSMPSLSGYIDKSFDSEHYQHDQHHYHHHHHHHHHHYYHHYHNC